MKNYKIEPSYSKVAKSKQVLCDSHYLPGDMEGVGIMKKVTNGDIGGSGV